MGLWAQVGIIFFTVSGGAYGLEALVGTVGPFWTLVLVVALPVFWAIPIGLMVAELSSAIPEDGGYYIWVKRGLGPFWGFQEGWWSLCYSAANMAIFPVFFVSYLSYFFPAINNPGLEMACLRIGISLTFVFVSLLFNIRGASAVGTNALANLFLVSFPFILMTIWGSFHGNWSNLGTAVSMPTHFLLKPSSLAAGLAIVLWNYSGWESLATCASEAENPQKNFPRALGLSLLIIISSYVIPLLAGFKVTLNPADWGDTSGWPFIAEKLGGVWLGWIGGGAALFSIWALYNSNLLCVAYLPTTMAIDGWLPKILVRKSPRTGAPYVALISMSVVVAAFCALSLKKLMVVDVLFYAFGLALEFLSLIALRKKDPKLVRPFKVPLPTWGLALMSIPPIAIVICVAIFSAMGEEGSLIQVGVVFVGVLAGIGIYYNRKKYMRG